MLSEVYKMHKITYSVQENKKQKTEKITETHYSIQSKQKNILIN